MNLSSIDKWPMGLLGVLALAACTTGQVETDVADLEQVPDPHSAVQWPTATSCPILINAILDQHERGQLPTSPEGAPLAILVDPLQNATIRQDIPLPVFSGADETSARCLMQIGGPIDGIDLDRRVLRQAKIHSSYPSKTRKAPNPEYENLKLRARSRDEDDEDSFDLLMTGDPMLDLIGLVAGGIYYGYTSLTATKDGFDLDRAMEETPSTIDVPVLSPYSYDLTELETSRRSRVTVSLIDRQTDEHWVSEIKLWERKRFALSDDRHPEDPTRQHDAKATLVTSTELADWESSTPALAVSRALNGVLETKPKITLASLGHKTESGQAPLSTEMKTLEPIGDIVRVGDDGEGRGFYVDSDHILTLARYTQGSSLTKVTTATGGTVYGMVSRNNPGDKLTLVFMPKPGDELPLLTHISSPDAENVPLGLTPGTPVGDENGIVAMVTSIDDNGVATMMSAAEIEQYLDRIK